MATVDMHLVAHEICKLSHVRQMPHPLLRALYREVSI